MKSGSRSRSLSVFYVAPPATLKASPCIRRPATAERVALRTPAAFERGEHAVAFESLSDEIAVEAGELAVVFDRRAVPQPPGERGFDQRVGVHVAEHVRHDAAGDGAG